MPTGVIKKWVTEKGFGFIQPDDGSTDLFAHIRQKSGAQEEVVCEGRRVTYEFEVDPLRQKPKATTWATTEGGCLPPQPPPAFHQAATASPPPHHSTQLGFNPGLTSGLSQLPATGGMDYSALLQAASAAAAMQQQQQQQQQQQSQAVPTPPQPSLAAYGMAQHVPQAAPAAVAPPPPPPAPVPVQHTMEEVEVPASCVGDLVGAGGAGFEEIKRRAGGDILLEMSSGSGNGATRLVKIRGPAISASLGASLVLMRASEVMG